MNENRKYYIEEVPQPPKDKRQMSFLICEW